MQSTLFQYTSITQPHSPQANGNLKTYRDKVDFIYTHYQQAVNEDRMLLYLYRKHFGTIIFNEDVIKRTGRLLRQLERKKDKPRFKREASYSKVARQEEEKQREYYSSQVYT